MAYIGIDPNKVFIETAIERYSSMSNFKIIKGCAEEIIPNINLISFEGGSECNLWELQVFLLLLKYFRLPGKLLTQ